MSLDLVGQVWMMPSAEFYRGVNTGRISRCYQYSYNVSFAPQGPVSPGGGGGGGGGGYSLCDGWYICAAVLTPFFHFGRIEHDLFGVFFSSTNSKAIFWGTKTTNFYKNRSFWPQIKFFPRSFWVQFSAASGTPPSVFRPSTPPGPVSLTIFCPQFKFDGNFTLL